MCGIIGVIGSRPAAPILLEGLRRLEYRGYDSAGVAILMNGGIQRRRAEGKLENLVGALQREPLAGTIGIGHTRWATHGAPTERNAHPHSTSLVSVVHNGIIENHRGLRQELEEEGQSFATETDSEVIVQLVDLNLKRGMDPICATKAALCRLEGAYAIAMIFAGHSELMVGARRGAPLAVGIGDGEMFIGSDALALVPFTREVVHLEDGDWTVIDRRSARFFAPDGSSVSRKPRPSNVLAASVDKGSHRHFMEKELHEHPRAILDTVEGLVDVSERKIALPDLPVDLAQVSRIAISGCGSAFYAGLVGRWWLEVLARLPADADVASEFRYRRPPLSERGLGLLVSQSGETADTLAVLRYMHDQGHSVVSVINVPESSMARESDAVLSTVAGPEIGVASTKSFTAQLSTLACLAIAAGRSRGTLVRADEVSMVEALLAVPRQVRWLLDNQKSIKAVAARIAQARDVLYLGRGSCYPVALESALKLKEICYIHAEGYAAGEMKHGSIALVEPGVPVVGLVPSGPLFEKCASNLQEVAARGAQLIVLSDERGAEKLKGIAAETVVLPAGDPFTVPMVYAVAVQILAYHVGVLKGCDVDRPRNLAKSVTVE
jgi:glutamine---fructose-6-phosphate transaminase (isomerizing)